MCASAMYWLRVLPEIKNHGIWDVLMLMYDKRKPAWNSFKYAPERTERRSLDTASRVYTAASESGMLDRFAEFARKWEKCCPAIIRIWAKVWEEFVPFCGSSGIRTAICATNAIEPINARLWPAGCPEVPVLGDHEPGPDREAAPAMNEPVEGCLTAGTRDASNDR